MQQLKQKQTDLPEKLSILGKRWVFTDQSERDVLALMQTYQLSEVIARILAARGYNHVTTAEMLSPSLKSKLPDPYVLKDMEKGVHRVSQAIIDHDPVAVFADYDVDGATASAQLRRYFKILGRETRLYIPDRIDEGYGPSESAMETLAAEGIKVIIMVDCGTLAYGPLARAKELGMDVIVLDHHLSEIKLPEACALVNPNRLDEGHCVDYLKDLCAAGVTFLFLVALQRALREQKFFDDKDEPDLRYLLDLVALGTVCDVMPLTHLNRVFVTHGLKLLEKRHNLGLATLMEVAGVSGKLSSYHLGFILGPRINAGGRVGQAWYGSTLLTTDDRMQAKDLALKLDKLNQERQALEKQMLEEAQLQVEQSELASKPVILVGSDKWHPGVIGIAASRLVEKFAKPALVVSYMFGEEGKGSGRSISSVNLGHLMHKSVEKGLLIKGGGHAMAAGFTVAKAHFDKFYEFLSAHTESDVKGYVPEIIIEGYLSIGAIQAKLMEEISKLEPFGQGHQAPKFALKNVEVIYAETMSGEHLRLMLKDESGQTIKAVAFRSAQNELGEVLLKKPKKIDLVGSIKEDTWGGRVTYTFQVLDGMV